MFPKSVCVFLVAMSCGVPASINIGAFALLNAAAVATRFYRVLREPRPFARAYGMKTALHLAN
jgi:hypothetical protein